MKAQPRASSAESDKTPRERFVSLGSRVMSVSKAEIDRRDKAWHDKKKRKK